MRRLFRKFIIAITLMVGILVWYISRDYLRTNHTDTGTRFLASNSTARDEERWLRGIETNLIHDLKFNRGDAETAIRTFCDSLIRGATSDSVKLRTFYDWICSYLVFDENSQAYKDLEGKRAVQENWKTAVLNKKSMAKGYTDLLIVMCKTQGIQCIHIEGESYSPEEIKKATKITSNKINAILGPLYYKHDWCLVTFHSGFSHLLDPSWDDFNQDKIHYFQDPFDFRCTHEPYNPNYQLIKPPLTAQDLLTRDMKAIKREHSRIKCIDAICIER